MGARNVGAVVKRLEDPRLLTGRGRYTDDIVLPGVLELAFVRSTEAHAAIKSIDLAAARALPGVVAVWTLADLGPTAQKPMVQSYPSPAIKQNVTQYPLAKDEVRYVGEALAVEVDPALLDEAAGLARGADPEGRDGSPRATPSP